MRSLTRKNEKGTILILALWALGILTVFTVYLSAYVRQEITVLSRFEKRQRLQMLLESCMKKALVVLENDIKQNEGVLTPDGKQARYNNEYEFKASLGEDACRVGYQEGREQRYGLVDEESKINLNSVSAPEFKRFLSDDLGMSRQRAQDIADTIYDWRVFGESSPGGFFSDNYYENLTDPYSPKKRDFEAFDELLLVKNINEELFEILLPYVTVYGDGKVNINTASDMILLNAGMIPSVAHKIVSVRRGKDGLEATGDDVVFHFPVDLVNELGSFVTLDAAEIENINQLIAQNKITTNSYLYRINVEGSLAHSTEEGRLLCVFDSQKKRIGYFREWL